MFQASVMGSAAPMALISAPVLVPALAPEIEIVWLPAFEPELILLPESVAFEPDPALLAELRRILKPVEFGMMTRAEAPTRASLRDKLQAWLGQARGWLTAPRLSWGR